MSIVLDQSLAIVASELSRATRIALCSENRALHGVVSGLFATTAEVSLVLSDPPFTAADIIFYDAVAPPGRALEFVRSLRSREPRAILIVLGIGRLQSERFFFLPLRGGADAVVQAPFRRRLTFLAKAIACLLTGPSRRQNAVRLKPKPPPPRRPPRVRLKKKRIQPPQPATPDREHSIDLDDYFCDDDHEPEDAGIAPRLSERRHSTGTRHSIVVAYKGSSSQSSFECRRSLEFKLPMVEKSLDDDDNNGGETKL